MEDDEYIFQIADEDEKRDRRSRSKSLEEVPLDGDTSEEEYKLNEELESLLWFFFRQRKFRSNPHEYLW